MNRLISFWGATICSQIFGAATLLGGSDACFAISMIWFAWASVLGYTQYRENVRGGK